MLRDGVIQFEAVHSDRPLDPALAPFMRAVIGWRGAMHTLGFIGQDEKRYDGVGFGNVSARVPPFRGPRGQESAFLITGTQTGKKPALATADLCVVDGWDLRRNRAHSHGRILPSSESLTHGAIYDTVPGARAVIHVHAPPIFARAAALKLPTSRAHIAYGTVAMAEEVARLWAEDTLRETRVFAMGGHEDGVIAFGADLDDAGARLMAVFARVHALHLP